MNKALTVLMAGALAIGGAVIVHAQGGIEPQDPAQQDSPAVGQQSGTQEGTIAAVEDDELGTRISIITDQGEVVSHDVSNANVDVNALTEGDRVSVTLEAGQVTDVTVLDTAAGNQPTEGAAPSDTGTGGSMTPPETDTQPNQDSY